MTAVLFQKLTAANRKWARAAAAFGCDVRYLNIAPNVLADVEELRQHRIRPVDFEELERVDPTIADSDSLRAIDRATSLLANDEMLAAAARLFPSVANGAQKMRLAMRERAEFFAFDANRINCWIAAYNAKTTIVVLSDRFLAFMIAVPDRKTVCIGGFGGCLRQALGLALKLL